MKKYSFLVYHSDYLDFLKDLQQLGVLHIRHRSAEPSDVLLQRMQELDNIRDTLRELREREVERADSKSLDIQDGLDIVQYYQNYSKEILQLEQQRDSLQKELDRIGPWGNFSIKTLEKLETAGLTVRFFSCHKKRFWESWTRDHPVQVIQTLRSTVYFVAFSYSEGNIDIDAEEMPRPEKSPGELKKELEDTENRIGAIRRQIDRYAELGLPAIQEALEEAGEYTELLTAIERSRKEADGSLMLLKGFAPATREDEIADLCERRQVLYLSEDPEPEDSPPVLLTNSLFPRLFEPIGEMFSLPAYRELDMTPFFAPFFMLFFGFCLGDAGYGIVILLGATLYKPRAKKSFRPVLTLAQFLGAATILFGMLTGTLFGINLLETRITLFDDIRHLMINSDQAFKLALVLGGVQILFGLILQAWNKILQFGFKHAISTIGWIILLLSIIDLMLLERTGKIAEIAAWTGVGLILFFNDLKTGLLGRLGKGVWELYGLIGIFGDVMSYIRLFALGISSAILGLVVNDIALQIRDAIPYVGPVIFILFLVIGHGANLMIAALGAFVHPLRLTFVEFYKHAGFMGGGKPYRPFSTGKENLLKK